MTLEQIRAEIIRSIWQAIAQSGVNLSALPQGEQEKLVRAIAESVMVTMNSMLDEVAQPEPASDSPIEGEERVLWEGRPFLSLVESYTLTTERLKITRGLLARKIENYELVRIQDIDYKQAMGERMFGIGDIAIRGHDASDPEVVLRNVPKPEEVYETLRRAWLDARKRYGLQFREYM